MSSSSPRLSSYDSNVDNHSSCQIDPDPTVIVCYNIDDSVCVKRYNTQTGTRDTPELVLSGVGLYPCVEFSQCGKPLAVGWDDVIIVIRNLDASEVVDSDVDGTTMLQHDESHNECEYERSDDENERGCGLLSWKCFCRGKYIWRGMLSNKSRSETVR